MTEHNRLPTAPVFIIDVDVRSVFFSDGHVWHKRFPFSLSCTKQSATLIRPNPTEFFSLLHSLSTLRLCDAKSVGRARLREQVRTAAEKILAVRERSGGQVILLRVRCPRRVLVRL